MVAIKEIEGKCLPQLQLISREIQILLHLRDHASIVQLQDILIVRDTIQLVFPLLKSTLYELIHSDPTMHLSHNNCKTLLVQLLMGLRDIHGANIIHRDLKPDNILLDRLMNLKICDFGLSRAITTTAENCTSDEMKLTEWLGTNGYKAPEIMLGCRSYGKPADIWSVGCIFAEMINKEQLLFGVAQEYDDFKELILKFGSSVLGNLSFIDNEEGLMIAEASKGKKPITVPFTQIFPSLDDNQALDLMKKLLEFDPRSRVTAEAALEHPYLKEHFEVHSATKGYSMKYTELQVQSRPEESLETVKEDIRKLKMSAFC